MDAHSVNLINNDKPVVVCCGDSITHGHIGYDWVSSLRRRDGSKIYINAGINADLTWNLNQRINDIIKHNPDYVTILIGTNDAIGSQPVKLIQDYYIQTKNLPQAPSIDWFEEQIEIFLKKIKENEVPTIFCESTVSAEAQMEVAKSSGAVFGGTFYVDSLSDLNGPAPTYIDLLRHNVRLITKGLSISKVKK